MGEPGNTQGGRGSLEGGAGGDWETEELDEGKKIANQRAAHKSN